MAFPQASEIVSPPPGAPPAAASSVSEATAVVMRALGFTAASGAVLAVLEDSVLVCRISSGSAAPGGGARIELDGTFLGLCVQSKKSVRTDDAEVDLRVENTAYSPAKPKSILAVPVRGDSGVLGVLAVYSTSPAAFTSTHAAILMTMADSIARHLKGLPCDPVPAPRPAAAPSPLAPSGVVVEPPPPKTPAVPLPPRPEEVAASAPPEVVKDKELLVLAADPAAAPRPSPALPPAPSKEPAKHAPSIVATKPLPKVPPTASVTTIYDLPRPRRRRNTERNYGALATLAAGLAIAVALGAWALHPSSDDGPPPPVLQVVAPPPTHALAAANTSLIPAAQAAAVPAAVPPAIPAAAKPDPGRLVQPATSQETAPQPPKAAVVEDATAIREPVRTPLPAPASVEAPALAMSAPAGLPVLLGPKAAAPTLRQSEVVPPRLISRVAPVYPPPAQRTRTTGTVMLSASIRPDGTVGQVKMLSGPAVFRDAAITAVRQWRYTPATANGEPVEATADIVLKFGK